MAGQTLRSEGRRRVAGVLVLAALFALPGLAYARAGLTADTPPPPSHEVRLVEPAPWGAFRAGAAVGVVAAVRGPTCTVAWDDGTAPEALPTRRGVCATARVVDRPGMYTVSVATPAAEVRVPVVVYDPHAGPARGSGVTGGFRYSVEAAYVPWRKAPAPTGAGAFEGPAGLSARVAAVDWVLVTPDRTTAVKGTAVSPDGTAYGFVLYGQGFAGRTHPLRLAAWQRLPSPGRHDPPGRLPDLD
jgi:hypothetical protein